MNRDRTCAASERSGTYSRRIPGDSWYGATGERRNSLGIGQPFARRGHTLGAVRAVTAFAFDRLGLHRGLLGRFLDLLEGLEHLYIDGLMTELSDAAEASGDYAAWQLEGLVAALQELAERGHRPNWLHAAASGAVMRRRLPEASGAHRQVRPGRLLYGLAPTPELEGAWPLRPALGWQTAIGALKRVPKGARVGEGGTWTARRATRLATLPVGYGDGYPERLGGRADVLVRRVRAPVIGRVGAELMLVDVTDVAGVQEGDRVTLIGRQEGEEIPAAELGDLLEVRPEAILARIPPHVPRHHFEGRAPSPPAGG